ncbi:MAG: hypothetical protein V8Q42_10855 [Anaerovoracaceae bacterium]
MVLNSGSFVYVRSDELSLSQNFAGNNYVYPGQIYKGLEFFIDTETACAEIPFSSIIFLSGSVAAGEALLSRWRYVYFRRNGAGGGDLS